AGHIHLVTIEHPGATPHIEAIKVAGMTWRHVVCDDLSEEEVIAQVRRELAANEPADHLVMRVTLKGTCSAAACARTIAALEELLAGCAVADIHDETEPVASSEEEARARADHPLLIGVLDDLSALAGAPDSARFADAQMEELCRRLNCQPSDLTPDVAATARQLVLKHLRD